ncbi:peptidase S8/S53 domain-containing protein [Syncephalis plumigaleata]|nr:peptidase S8/S53 domain-containing protein [Syncephalis plumigaleata]
MMKSHHIYTILSILLGLEATTALVPSNDNNAVPYLDNFQVELLGTNPHIISKIHKKPIDLTSYHKTSGVEVLHSKNVHGDGVNIAIINDMPPSRVSYNKHNSNSYRMESVIKLKTAYAKGVAPDAQLTSYNVFDNHGSTSTSAVLSALNMAINQGAHVITLPEIKTIDASATELKNLIINAEKEGIVMIIAASHNNYSNDKRFSYIGLPVISVGGYRTPYQLAHWFEELGTKKRIGFMSPCKSLKYEKGTFDIVALNGNQQRISHTIPTGDKIALMIPPEADIESAMQMAIASNAQAIVATYSAARHMLNHCLVPVFLISQDDTNYIRFRKEQPKFLFSGQYGNLKEPEYETIGEVISSGISQGMPVLADILVPGDNILAAIPGSAGAYGPYNDICAAVAYAAGTAALLLPFNDMQLTNTQFIKARLQNNALPILDPKSRAVEPVTSQGAGMIDVADAYLNPLTYEPGEINLGVLPRTSIRVPVRISSLGSILKLTVTYIPAKSTRKSLMGTPVPTPIKIDLTFSEIVKSGNLAQFEVLFNLNPNIPQGDELHFSGYIVVKEDRSNGMKPFVNTLRIPYQGIVG